MFSILADAMFTATLAKRGSDIPERRKSHPDRYVAEEKRKTDAARLGQSPYRGFW